MNCCQAEQARLLCEKKPAVSTNFWLPRRYFFLSSDDLALIERCRSGDRRALQLLVERYHRPVLNAAFRILGNSEDAADATQTTFLKVFEHLDHYDDKYRFFSWIYRIAVNESIDQLHRSRALQALDEDEASGADGPEEHTATDRLSSQVQEALMALGEDYRVVLVLRHFSECSYEQIGEILKLPEKTVKSRIYMARQQMKNLLAARGVSQI